MDLKNELLLKNQNETKDKTKESQSIDEYNAKITPEIKKEEEDLVINSPKNQNILLPDVEKLKSNDELTSKIEENQEYEKLLANLEKEKLAEDNYEISDKKITDNEDYEPIAVEKFDKNEEIDESIDEDFVFKDSKDRKIFLFFSALALIVGLALGFGVSAPAAVGASLGIFLLGFIASFTSFYMKRNASVDDLKAKNSFKSNKKEKTIDLNIPSYQKAKENSKEIINENINEIKPMNPRECLESLKSSDRQYQNF